jgi:phosphatidylglycerophosphate synthase
MGRILGTPVIGYWIIQGQEDPQHLKYALAGCVVAATSDYVDGYLAKNYNMATVFGSWLDPIADKFLVNTLAISLWYIGLDPATNPILSMGGGSGEAATTAAAAAAAEFVPVAYSIPTYVIVLWLAKDVSLVAGGTLFLRQQKQKLQKQDDEQSSLSSLSISSLPSNSPSKNATESVDKMALLHSLGNNETSGSISPLQVQPTTIGKVNTALQFTTLGVALGMGIVLTGSGDAGNVVAMVHGLDSPTTLPVLFQGLCVLSSATTVASTISYMGNIRKLL